MNIPYTCHGAKKMAFVSSLQVAHARKALKAAYPQFKFSVTGGGTSSVYVALVSGSVDLSADCQDGYAQLNQYYLQNYKNEELYRNILATLMQALAQAGNPFFDVSDIMTDYFHTAYYYHLHIGKWNKPYEFKQS